MGRQAHRQIDIHTTNSNIIILSPFKITKTEARHEVVAPVYVHP